jgi:hypothetical protein
MWRLLFLAACSGSSPTMMFMRGDAGLQFSADDLSTASSTDLAGADLRPVADLAGADLASGSSCGAALASLSWNFEGGSNGFTHDAIDGFSGDTSWPFDEWQRGGPTGAGPGFCHTGAQCWGTYIAGNYINCERAMLETPVVDLSACAATNVKLVFWQWYNFWTDAGGPWYDGGLVEFSGDGGSTWTASGAAYPGTIAINPSQGFGFDCLAPGSFHVDGKPGYVQSATTWQEVDLPIPPSLRTSMFQARWAYSTGVSYATTDPDTSRMHANPGWYVDDVSIVPQ